MSTKWTVVGLIVVLIVAAGAYLFPQATQVTQVVGSASAGNFFTNFTQFAGGHDDINRVNASSTKASVTMTGSEFLNYDELDYTINNAAGDTLTLPASTTPICASLTVGERRALLIRNASTTPEALTIAASASIELKSGSSTDVIAGTTDGTNIGTLTIQRIPTTAGGVGCVAFFGTSS